MTIKLFFDYLQLPDTIKQNIISLLDVETLVYFRSVSVDLRNSTEVESRRRLDLNVSNGLMYPPKVQTWWSNTLQLYLETFPEKSYLYPCKTGDEDFFLIVWQKRYFQVNYNHVAMASRFGHAGLVRILLRFWELPENSEIICAQVAAQGRLDIIKLFHNYGYPFDENTCMQAALHGHFDIINFCIENNIPYNKNHCITALTGWMNRLHAEHLRRLTDLCDRM